MLVPVLVSVSMCASVYLSVSVSLSVTVFVSVFVPVSVTVFSIDCDLICVFGCVMPLTDDNFFLLESAGNYKRSRKLNIKPNFPYNQWKGLND